MKSINWGRVILGGIVAGVLINISEFVLNANVLKSNWEAAMKACGKSMTETGSTMAVWIILGFAIGIAALWLYAAIRPRYGPGPGTAARAGIAVWFFRSLVGAVASSNLELFPARMMTISTAWVLVELILATVLGAWLYKEAAA